MQRHARQRDLATRIDRVEEQVVPGLATVPHLVGEAQARLGGGHVDDDGWARGGGGEEGGFEESGGEEERAEGVGEYRPAEVKGTGVSRQPERGLKGVA